MYYLDTSLANSQAYKCRVYLNTANWMIRSFLLIPTTPLNKSVRAGTEVNAPGEEKGRGE